MCFTTAIKVSVVVGITLSLINQGDKLLQMDFSTELYVRLFLNFLVPFLVASYSRYTMIKEMDLDKEPA
jgi:hypothetical protein